MPTGRSQCGSILAGTTAIPLMHSRRIPPSQSLVVNSCNAMRVPILQRAFFFGTAKETHTQGPRAMLPLLLPRYMTREKKGSVCLCVHTTCLAWQTRRTRNAPQSMLLLMMLAKGYVREDRGGIAWHAMHGHSSFNSNSCE